MSWFPNNLARNSLARLSNIEIQSLVLQRLWKLLNRQENELRAKFLGGTGAGSAGSAGGAGSAGSAGSVGSVGCHARARNGTLVPDGCRKRARVTSGTARRARRASDARMTLDIVVTVRIKHYI